MPGYSEIAMKQFIGLMLIAPVSFAQTPSQAPTPASPPARGPTLAQALKAAQVAVEACQKIDQRIAVSVVDSAGVLKVVLAADGASARGVLSSGAKATTSLAFGAPSGEIGEKAKSDAALAARLEANPAYNARAGGILLRVGNEVIGAIGVGGARGSEKDEACALEGFKAVENTLR